MVALLLSTSCVFTNLRSYTAPSWDRKPYASIAVLVVWPNLEERYTTEQHFIYQLQKLGQKCGASIDLVNPAQMLSLDSTLKLLAAAGYESCLFVSPIGSSSISLGWGLASRDNGLTLVQGYNTEGNYILRCTRITSILAVIMIFFYP